MGGSEKEIWHQQSWSKEVCAQLLPKVSDSIDERFVEVECYELQKIYYEIISECMSLDEQFQISFIIDKLPCSLKVYLKKTITKQNNF